MKPICRLGQATDDNMAYAYCIPDPYDYKHTLGICNNFYFYAATVVARTSLNVTLYAHCLCCYYLKYAIPFKSVSSLPNQRYPNLIFIPINPLGLLPHFLTSSSLSATRNNILSTGRFPLKSPVPNFTALCTKPIASPTFTTKFPFCCSHYCVLWSSYDFLTNSSLHFINTFPSPFHTPIFQPWGKITGVEKLEILISCM